MKADPGADRTILVGQATILDGTASEGDDLSYTWEVASANRGSAALVDSGNGIAEFRADAPGTYALLLTVAEGSDTKSAAVIVTVEELVARIVGPTDGTAGESLTFSAKDSRAPANAIKQWSVAPKAQLVLTAPLQLTPQAGDDVTFLAEDAGEYVITLVVTVPGGPSEQTRLTVILQEPSEESSPSDIAWRDRAIEARTGALARVQSSASKWDASLTTFLAVFSAVTFIAGPKTLSDISSPTLARFALGLTAAAFLIAFTARILVANVANATPEFGDVVVPSEYRKRELETAKHGSRTLRNARNLVIVAGALIATGSLLIAFAATRQAKASPPQALVRTSTDTYCGVLSADENGSITIGKIAIGRANEVTMVPSCNIQKTSTTGESHPWPPQVLFAVIAIVGTVSGSVIAARGRQKRTITAAALLLFSAAMLWYIVQADLEFLESVPRSWSLAAIALLAPIAGLIVGRWVWRRSASSTNE